ncbi:MAG: hypothetical protein R2939_17570 [Kofleriaceae bacterium]
MNARKTVALLLSASLAACGGDDAPIDVDAAGPDAETTPDAPVAGTVTVELDVPMADIPPGTRLLFLDADDTVVSDVAATTGTHQAELFAGGSVVVVLPPGGPAATGGGGVQQQQLAFLNVEPGLTLTLTGGDGPPPASNIRTLTAPTVAGAANYQFSTPCGNATSGTPSVALDLAYCGATTDVYVAAYGAVTATGIGGASLLKTAIVRGRSTAADIDFSAEPTSDPGALDLDITGIRPSVATANVNASVIGDGVGWVLQPTLNGSESAPFTGGATSLTGTLPDVAGASLGIGVYTSRSGGGSLQYNQVAPADLSQTLDLGSVDAAWLDAVVPDLEASELRLITSGGGDYGLASGSLYVGHFAPAPVLVGGPSLESLAVWQFVSLLGAHQAIRFPTLPAAYATANLTEELGATGLVGGSVTGYRSSAGVYVDAFADWFGPNTADGGFGTALVASSDASFGAE